MPGTHEPERPVKALPKVFINGRFFSQRVTGVQRYARETLLRLDQLLYESGQIQEPWTLLVPKGTETPKFRWIRVEPTGRSGGHLWEQVDLALRARHGLLVSFGPTGPLVQRRQIVTVHDASVVRFPTAYGFRFRWWYRLLIASLVKRAVRTIAVSEFSASEAIECFRAPTERVRIATEGWQHLNRIEPDESVIDRHNLRGESFVLAVSSPTPNKNFAAISEAIRLLGASSPPCVIAGSADPAVFRATGGPSETMTQLGYVTDEQLKALYSHASCFVFPSFYEGFGIPPLEAMACGCPVIASTASSVREVCGDAALYFDPKNPAELAQKLKDLAADAPLRKAMSAAGIERARHYSWDESARLNLKYIQESLGIA